MAQMSGSTVKMAGWLLAGIACVWIGFRMLAPDNDYRPPIRHNLSEDEIRALAATTTEGEIVMYSTTECVYCMQAKQWLAEHGFSFKDCNMSVSEVCEREYVKYGATGTPFLVVHGRQMKNGFNKRELLANLQY